MKGKITYSRVIDVSFESLKADPLIILKKLPHIQRISKYGETSYFAIMKPFRFNAAFSVIGKGHITLVVDENEIRWIPCPDDEHPECNGDITGKATPTADGKTLVEGDIEMEHPFLNIVTWSAMRPWVERIAHAFMDEFVANFANSSYRNVIHPE